MRASSNASCEQAQPFVNIQYLRLNSQKIWCYFKEFMYFIYYFCRLASTLTKAGKQAGVFSPAQPTQAL